MSDTDPTVLQQLAAAASRHLVPRTFEAAVGRPERRILVVADDAPAWVTALCRAAHDDLPPDDWRFEFVSTTLDALAEHADSDGARDAATDPDALYPYTADRLRWLASRLDRPAYCDEAAEEWGARPAQILDYVALGLGWELGRVFDAVRCHLDTMTEAAAGEAPEGFALCGCSPDGREWVYRDDAGSTLTAPVPADEE